MKFLDANVFILAAFDKGPRGERARGLLAEVGPPRPHATSALVLDEVFWALRKLGGRSAALRESKRLATIPGLRLLPVSSREWATALRLMEAHDKLKPRDALHAACTLEGGLSVIVSVDADFDGIPGVKRVGLD